MLSASDTSPSEVNKGEDDDRSFNSASRQSPSPGSDEYVPSHQVTLNPTFISKGISPSSAMKIGELSLIRERIR